jgi:hypothetical protein
MKKIIAVSLFIFASNLFAQSAISKGAYTIGGNIGFTSTSMDGNSDSQSNFYFNPSCGYFFINNFYAGLSLSYTHTSYGSTTENTIGLGPSIRYYFIAEKLNPFLGISYSYNKSTRGNDEYSNTGFTLSGGADYFVNSFFAIEGSINYSFIKYKYPPFYFMDDEINGKIFNIGFGVKYFIF